VLRPYTIGWTHRRPVLTAIYMWQYTHHAMFALPLMPSSCFQPLAPETQVISVSLLKFSWKVYRGSDPRDSLLCSHRSKAVLAHPKIDGETRQGGALSRSPTQGWQGGLQNNLQEDKQRNYWLSSIVRSTLQPLWVGQLSIQRGRRVTYRVRG
jgi:hypothetical protein